MITCWCLSFVSALYTQLVSAMSPTNLQKQRPLWQFTFAQHLAVYKALSKTWSYLKLTPTVWSLYCSGLPEARRRLMQPNEPKIACGCHVASPTHSHFPCGDSVSTPARPPPPRVFHFLCSSFLWLLFKLQFISPFSIYWACIQIKVYCRGCKSRWENLHSWRKFVNKQHHWLIRYQTFSSTLTSLFRMLDSVLPANLVSAFCSWRNSETWHEWAMAVLFVIKNRNKAKLLHDQQSGFFLG